MFGGGFKWSPPILVASYHSPANIVSKRCRWAGILCWLPLELQFINFQYFLCICNSLQSLTLKAPTFWKRSHLKCSDLPAILSRVEQVITGVLWIYGAILWAASCTSWMVITASLVEGEVILQNAKCMNHSRVQKYCKVCMYFKAQSNPTSQKLWTSPRFL